MLRRLALTAAASASGRGWSVAGGVASVADAPTTAAHRSSSLMRSAASAGAAAARPASTTRTSPASTSPMPAFVFLGAPGVGKGTYSVRVAAALGAAHVSAGDLVRAEIRAGTELGKEVRRVMRRS